jgi:hypothetical protein
MCKQPEDRNAGRVPSHRVSKLVKLSIAFALFSCWTSAPAAEVQANEDPVLLLQRIRSRIAEHLFLLSNYTCHVVIARLERAANSSSLHRRDSVELDVAFVGNSELFSRPGETQFVEQPISQIVPDGMIGNDTFGSHDDDVFLGDGPTFKYAGLCKRDGHKAFRYDFRVPLENSRLLVKQGASADAMVAYQGSFWVDAETLDMLRLTWKTDHIPPSVGIRSITKSMQYQVVHVGNSDFVLPLHSELTSFDQQGNYRWNTTTLKHCQEFSGGSTVTYGAPVDGAAAQNQPRPR